MPNSAIWFRKNAGNWNGSDTADPATGTGGFSLVGAGGLAPPYFAAVGQAASFFGGAPFTANFGGSAFSETPPAGSVDWGSADTWNPSDKGPVVTLSNGDLTMNVGGEVQQGVRSIASHTEAAGVLYYFEGRIASGGSTVAIGFGIANASAKVTNIGEDGKWEFPGWATVSLTGVIQVNQVEQGSVGTGFAVGDTWCCAVFIESGGGEPVADMADFWFGNTDGFVDLSNAANRRKFIDANGCPLFLGASGQQPFGLSPPVFLTITEGDPSSFANNNGLGGAFAVSSGSLLLSSSSPCCSITTADNFNVPLGANPQVTLSVSDDGGRTFNLVSKKRSIGKIGEYLTRIRWLKMGQFRQRIVKLEITDPVKRAFVGFYTDIGEGMG